MLLHSLLLSNSRTHSQNTAVTLRDTSLTYDTLGQDVVLFGRFLLSLGLQAGDRVGIYLNKQTEGVTAYFGTSWAGCVFVPINPGLKPAQVSHILRDCNVSLLLTSSAQLTSLSEILVDCADLRHVVCISNYNSEVTLPPHLSIHSWSDLQNADQSITPFRRVDADVVSILYTSGSTGKPKGVVLSHRNMVAGALSVAEYLENSEDDKILAVLPFSFDAGFSQMTTGFSVGAEVVLMDYLLPRDVVKAVAHHGITGLTGVPPLWNQLATLEWPEDAKHSLRYFANTGGAMPTETLGKLRNQLPNTTPFLMYGLTEAFRSTYLPPEEIDRRPTSIGKAIPNAEILVVNEEGQVCEPDEPGELVHRGALVALGYWNDPEKTAARFKPAPGQSPELPIVEMAVWSGDTVTRDRDGFLYFVGRKDDMIKSSGYRISPTELEEVVYKSGLVSQCAALGVPHPTLGQGVVVVCDAEPGTEEEIISSCRNHLPNYMVPGKVVTSKELPKNQNGKIDRKLLSEQYSNLFIEV